MPKSFPADLNKQLMAFAEYDNNSNNNNSNNNNLLQFIVYSLDKNTPDVTLKSKELSAKY